MQIIVAVVAALICVASTSSAETLELSTGQRIEGAVKSVNEREVVLDVAGQSLTLPREKVSVIYFASPPKTPVGNPLSDALRILKGLQSATTGGISYRDYAPRVTDAKVQLDQLLGEAHDGPVTRALAEALGFYVYASNAWNAKIAKSNYEAVALNPLFEKCEPLKREVESLGRRSGTRPLSDATSRGIAIAIFGVEPLMNCASDRVSAAERLLRAPGNPSPPTLSTACPPGFELSLTENVCVRPQTATPDNSSGPAQPSPSSRRGNCALMTGCD